jgi:hypothetical protein
VEQRVLQFEYQQSLVQDSERAGWSETVSISVRLLSAAITSGWYRQRFAKRGNDFIILLAIAMHARPLKGEDLHMLVNLRMATPQDEGRLYARVSDAALADELGMSRATIARATRRLAEERSIHAVEIPETLIAFRDSHGRFNGNKVYLVAGDIQSRFLEKNIEKIDRATKSSPVKADRVIKQYSPATDWRINGKDGEEVEEEEASLSHQVFAYFASRKGVRYFHPTIKEQVALEKLIREGFSLEQIMAGIEVAFIRPTRPRYFTHCAAIARDLIHFQQETRSRDTRQPESREPEALGRTDQRENPDVEVVEPYLAHAVAVYRSSGRAINADLLARLRLMSARCDLAARAAGTSGGEWLAEALTCALGVARPGSLLNYAEAVLSDWMGNGHPTRKKAGLDQPRFRSREARRSTKEPAAHEGIRQYLEKYGGERDGQRD